MKLGNCVRHIQLDIIGIVVKLYKNPQGRCTAIEVVWSNPGFAAIVGATTVEVLA